ncbi:DinB family protein [Flavipsychrobacter stenotrophus]|uniref:DinB family protein n=1 Tax=Flavipsychrobacter stenotrophus TaxID=2077091 RepID=UPI001F0BC7A5|nr:DinB family protein [Flavipsychrobacter stenotrophus]
MALNQILIAELKHESANTRKMLERVPTEKNDWKPHEKSMKIGRLASHIAEIPTWITMMVTSNELDLVNMPAKPFVAESSEELLSVFDQKLEEAVTALGGATDEYLQTNWILRRGEHVIYDMPRAAFLRSLGYSHLYHHRGQLSVYLRLLDIPVPGMYGPTADDVK